MEPSAQTATIIRDCSSKKANEAWLYALDPQVFQREFDKDMSKSIVLACASISFLCGFFVSYFKTIAGAENFWAALLWGMVWGAGAAGLLGVVSHFILFGTNNAPRFTWKAPRRNYEYSVRTGKLIVIPQVLDDMWGDACNNAELGPVSLSDPRLAPHRSTLKRLSRWVDTINDSTVSEETRTRYIAAVKGELGKFIALLTRNEPLEHALNMELRALGY